METFASDSLEVRLKMVLAFNGIQHRLHQYLHLTPIVSATCAPIKVARSRQEGACGF